LWGVSPVGVRVSLGALLRASRKTFRKVFLASCLQIGHLFRRSGKQGLLDWPTCADFEREYLHNLHSAMSRYRGLAAWAIEYGYEPVGRGRRPRMTEQQIREQLRLFIAGRPPSDRFPRFSEFRDADKSDLYVSLHLRGLAVWAEEFGFAYRPPSQWNDETIESALAELLADRTTWPSQKELKRLGAWPLMQAVYRTGGRERWAERFGITLD
jgi:hypothetical protein